MKAKDAIRQTIEMANMTTGKYLEDLDDAAFLSRPVAGMNHMAWQIGHLISSERGVIDVIKPGFCPALPEGFDAKHRKETSTSDDPKAFCTKAEYVALWQAQRAATLAVLDSLDEADLDAPAPEGVRQWCPTVGQAMNMMGGLHAMMHVGQYVAVRRSLNLPIAM